MNTISSGHDEAALEFPVRGERVAAILRTPCGRLGAGTAGAPGAPGAPGIVLTGPFTGVKEQVVSVYARRLADSARPRITGASVTAAVNGKSVGSTGDRVAATVQMTSSA